ncbi:hypothetical protein Pcinc_033142, partial [Petrolisthes cinctipes]
PLTGTAVDIHNAWVTVGSGEDPAWPNIQILFHAFTIGSDFGTFQSAVYNFDPWRFKRYYSGTFDQQGYTMID